MLVLSPYTQGARVVGVGDKKSHLSKVTATQKKSAPMRPSKRTLDPSKCSDLLPPNSVFETSPLVHERQRELSAPVISDSEATKSSQKSAVGRSGDYEEKLCIEGSFKVETILRIYKRRRFLLQLSTDSKKRCGDGFVP